MKIEILNMTLDLERSEMLRDFTRFDPAEWSIVKHTPKWTVDPGIIRGGGPDEPKHGQIFCETPIKGDVVLDFEARIIPPSYHDLVWFWNTRFGSEPWSAGYLGCLAGWWTGTAGIEKLPDYVPSSIAPSHNTEPGRWYHITSGSFGSVHFIAVDGKLVTYFSDKATPDPSQPGYFGFGVYQSHAEYRFLRVYRPFVKSNGAHYEPGTKSA